jgi:ferredoxin
MLVNNKEVTMRVKVNQDACIGCGACVSICPEVFSFNDEGFSEAIANKVNEEDEEKIREAMDSCPTEAIFETNEND